MRNTGIRLVPTSPRIRWIRAVVFLGLGWAARDLRTITDVEVSTSAVTAGPITRHIVAVGTLQAVKTVEVGTEVSGVVQSLEADYNSPVHAGQVIARIDPAAYDAQASEARAALAQAQATSARAQADVRRFEAAVEDARTRLGRAVALSKTQIIPQSDVDAAGIDLGTATADLAAGEAAADQAEAAVQQAAAAVEKASIDVEHTMTAQVALVGARHHHAVRIPDLALQFHPPLEVLRALGEPATLAPDVPTVWEFDGTQLTPITVRAGLAGGGWTELLSGPIRSGDALVTSAVVQRRSGL